MGFWQGRHVAVPGGAGFIGSHLCEQLVEAGAEVTVVDNLDTGRLSNLAAIRGKIRIVEGDVTDPAVCATAFAGQDTVMNMAAQAPGVGMSHVNHDWLLGRNALIGSAVLEAARQAGVERVLVVSSSCVYPDSAPVPTPELPLFTGEPELVNRGYGWGKRYNELQAMHYAERFGMKIAIGRPFNAYGGRDLANGERSHVIPALISKLYSEAPELVVWGSGRQTRSFIHARDVAAGLRILTEKHAVCEPINVGHDVETTLGDLARLLMEISGIDKPLVFDTTKPEGCLRKAADMTRFKEVTGGYQPATELRDGLKEMLDAHLALRAKG